MTLQLPAVGRLSTAQTEAVLRCALLAPSTHNTQPWRFRCTPAGIELHADPDRALPAADPDGRELLLSCGAALFNLRIAIQALGIDPATTLFPHLDRPGLLAVVRPFASRRPDARATKLAAAIPHRHTNRRPFETTPVPPPSLAKLRQAAELEHAWMPALNAGQRDQLHKLVRMAHEIQLAEPAFLDEWARWTGRDRSSRDGVPSGAAGVSPADNDAWVLRDFGTREEDGETPGAVAGEPLIVVIGSFQDEPIDRLRAGQAMERVLLTATGAGLDASFISQPVEVPAVRAELRQLLGGGLWPQIVLRIGYGEPVPWTPRRPLPEVLLPD